MTAKEIELLEIAKTVLELNSDIGARLTGSLMLAVRGINKRREAQDIDIICEYLCEKDSGRPIVPSGFREVASNGFASEVNAMQFRNADDLKIEFMVSEEDSDEINGVLCGEVLMLLAAKQRYVLNDKNEESKSKHEQDLAYLFENNVGLKEKYSNSIDRIVPDNFQFLEELI